MTTYTVQEEKKIISVSQLNRSAKLLLEQSFPRVWVSGELSNLARPSSGHLYFTLKDQQAQIRCALFKNRTNSTTKTLEDGMQVLVQASLSLYEGRGDYQLIVQSIEPAGDGLLQQQFEALKRKLDGLGWFDAAHKKVLPRLPHKIGIVTSPSGAAVRDVLTTLKRRFPAIDIIIYPTEVQGPQAGPQIAQQIALANARAEVDCLIVTRGGGSLEDLWAFNEEVVAKQIFESRIPIISAVGHEINFTIADFVADIRAATPTAAAELASPDGDEWVQAFEHQLQGLTLRMKQSLHVKNDTVHHLSKRLRHPGQLIQEQMQRLDELELRQQQAIVHFLKNRRHDIANAEHRLNALSPLSRINQALLQNQHYADCLRFLISQKLEHDRHALQLCVGSLNQLNPLGTLERGYTLVKKDNTVIASIGDIKKGDAVSVQFHDGVALCEVTALTEM